MFLALTADQRFWDTSQEILFLGEWCKLDSKQAEWSKLTYKTLPDVRDTINNQCDKLNYADILYEKYISYLSNELNKLHSVKYSKEYWRIVAGPWLRSFIQGIYVRYLTIKMAEAEGVVTDTLILRSNPDKAVPYDVITLGGWFALSDEFNQYIFGRIIKEISPFPYHEISVDLSLEQSIRPHVSLGGNLKRTDMFYKIICSLNDIYSLCFPLKLNTILIFNSFMANADIIKLCLKLHQFPHLIDRIPDPCGINPFSKEMRSKIILPRSENDEFDSLLSVLIPEQIPIGIIENFEEISHSIKKYEGKIKVIYSANSRVDLVYSILSANISEKGGRIIETQHGGGFGTAQYSLLEEIQKEESDLYLSWGWSDSKSNVFPMSTGSKFHILKNIRDHNNEKGHILLIEYTYPRYDSVIPLEYPIGSHYLNYVSEQYAFCSSLSQTAISLLKLRLYVEDYGRNMRQQWLNKFPNIDNNSEGKKFHEQLKESRLAISTSSSTTILECFVANVPTIMFWNPNFVKLRPSAQPYFDKLHDVGILHYTPQSAAKLVNEICDDPKKWWMQPEIQQAKDEFCYQFARTSDDWMDQLADVLKRQLELAEIEIKARKKTKK